MTLTFIVITSEVVSHDEGPRALFYEEKRARFRGGIEKMERHAGYRKIGKGWRGGDGGEHGGRQSGAGGSGRKSGFGEKATGGPTA